jgi:hypothetical protein
LHAGADPAFTFNKVADGLIRFADLAMLMAVSCLSPVITLTERQNFFWDRGTKLSFLPQGDILSFVELHLAVCLQWQCSQSAPGHFPRRRCHEFVTADSAWIPECFYLLFSSLHRSSCFLVFRFEGFVFFLNN